MHDANSSLPWQNGRHFEDNIFKYIFLNEKFCILIWMSLKLVLEGPTDNKWALVYLCIYAALGEMS